MPAPTIRGRKERRRDVAERRSLRQLSGFDDPAKDRTFGLVEGAEPTAGGSRGDLAGREAVSLGKIGSYVSVPTERYLARPNRSEGTTLSRSSSGAGRDGSTAEATAERDSVTQSSPLRPGSGDGVVADVRHVADYLAEAVRRGIEESGEGPSQWGDLPPPTDSEAEEVVLAALLWGQIKPATADLLTARDIYDPTRRGLWTAARKLARTRPPPAAPTTDEILELVLHHRDPQERFAAGWGPWLAEVVRLSRAEGLSGSVVSYVLELLDSHPHSSESTVVEAARRVHELSERRQLIRLLRSAWCRLALGTTSAARCRARLVEKMGGLLP